MTGSRWADTEEDKAAEAERKRARVEKKRLKAAKAAAQQREQQGDQGTPLGDSLRIPDIISYALEQCLFDSEKRADLTPQAPPAKRRRTSVDGDEATSTSPQDGPPTTTQQTRQLLHPTAPSWSPSRRLTASFEPLNHIEEGSYGTVSRARDLATSQIVALKKLKMEHASSAGFPVTALREIQCLQAGRHENIVRLREVITGETSADTYLVMDFIEHDLKTLLLDNESLFTVSETKTLLRQLLSAVAHLHAHWILHRDIKTSNILLSNRGELKLADFGMARRTSDPPPELTRLVVTLWYRAPELLLGAEVYDGKVDVWSVGCCFGELLAGDVLLAGKSEVDQTAKTFGVLGYPDESSWAGWRRLPGSRAIKVSPAVERHTDVRRLLAEKFRETSPAGIDLLASLLALDPEKRPTAGEALGHEYFREAPRPKAKELFPSFPSKAGLEKRRRARTPSAPRAGGAEGDFE